MLQDIRSYFREMNVAEGLADAMLRIPPKDVHYLTEQEAKAYGLTRVDPVFEETNDLQQAQKYGVDRRELMRRRALVEKNCRFPELGSADDPHLSRYSACIEATMKTGRPPVQAVPDASR